MSLRAFLFLLAAAPSLVAQQPVTRAQAVAAALARGTRAAFGRADSAAAAGALHGARLYPNPSLGATYTKDLPHYHVIADLPLDLPWIRAARIGTAASARDAVRYGVAFERAAIRFDMDTAYTRALAAAAGRSEEHTSELQSPDTISYAVFCLKKKHKTEQKLATLAHFKKKKKK